MLRQDAAETVGKGSTGEKGKALTGGFQVGLRIREYLRGRMSTASVEAATQGQRQTHHPMLRDEQPWS